jgi:peptidoglycan/LPS O-acetylase OafA/YrhL
LDIRIGHEAPESKLQSIEIIRFLAALTVVVWHYQFYFFDPMIDRDELPFSAALSVFYHSGFYAVDWFWVLSGYVFFFTYRDVLESRRMTALTFFSRRFARLYPLNSVTLVIVAALQALYIFSFKTPYPVYSNDVSVWTFVSHLFMASNWISTQYTFNGPVWSVSVEILIYVLFFFSTKYIGILEGVKKTILVCALCVIAFHFAIRDNIGTLPWITECASCFYIGGVVYEIRRHYSFAAFNWIAHLIVWCAIVVAAVALFVFRPRYAWDFAIPAAVILLTVSVRAVDRSRIIASLARVGNWTYGSYLLHFPIAFLIVICARAVDFDLGSIAKSPIFFVGYIVAVFAVAEVSYKFFENPVRHALRSISA